MNNLTESKGSWEETKGRLKLKFAMLTNNDLLLLDGEKDALAARLEVKLGKTKELIGKIISEL